MAGWKEILLDVLKLTDEVKRLNQQTEKLAERTIAIDKRVVRLETIIEIKEAKKRQTALLFIPQTHPPPFRNL